MIVKRIFLLLFNVALGNFLIAQSIKFNKAFPVISGLSSESFSVMNETDGYILYGVTVDSTNHQDVALVKIDSLGNIVKCGFANAICRMQT